MRFPVAYIGTVALAALGAFAGACRADDPPAQNGLKGLPDLVAALKASPGCLGAETAKTASGKSVIFAWFEDKQAAVAWFKSAVHQQVMRRLLPDARSGRKPRADVPDDSGPIMAVASVTLNDKPTKDNPSPFKQIAIELYQPLGGGLNIGGRFAPEKMKLPPRKEKAEEKWLGGRTFLSATIAADKNVRPPNSK